LSVSVSNDPDQPPVQIHQPRRGDRRRGRRADRVLGIGLVAVALVGGWHQSSRLQREVAGLRRSVQAAEQERHGLFARVDAAQRGTEAEKSLLQARLDGLRRKEPETSRVEPPAAEASSLRDDLESTRARLAALEEERTAGQRVIRDFGGGVCLIQASYAFYDDAGRPLRDRPDTDAVPTGSEGSGAGSEAGPIHTVDYYGTGFLVDAHGRVLTNRHVAEPWWNDETADRLAAAGYKPRFVTFRAFFPQQGEPFDLVTERKSETMDLAVLRVDLRGRSVPVLPIDRSGKGAVAGQPMMVMGYPTGLEAILAKAESKVVKEILETQGPSSERVTEALSRQGLIRPTTTQGHIGDVTATDIVFDAATTQGGSGGPIFNKQGQVIAVEYALLTKFGGNSFAIPISYAVELLPPPS
jgi:S1-C subfamily serine protease